MGQSPKQKVRRRFPVKMKSS
ncbi:hypothetical protein EI555_016768 [Monodon monoceros]|uniref:Uncharacterized protein n=1 Tax=Monodon monoceros TaxID=40151 RepID=A0A4U1FCB1_MONMO|nr:hypothetical protein EI555_016768 [Monodon monoceros]